MGAYFSVLWARVSEDEADNEDETIHICFEDEEESPDENETENKIITQMHLADEAEQSKDINSTHDWIASIVLWKSYPH